MRWLVELPWDSITIWEELLDVFLERFFLSSKMVKLRRSTENFKRIDGKPLNEMWLRFQKLCSIVQIMVSPTILFFNIFMSALMWWIKYYWSIGKRWHNKSIFATVSALLDDMTKINQGWYTHDDLISFMPKGPSKEQLAKDHERDKNMAKMMTQLGLLIKHVMVIGH